MFYLSPSQLIERSKVTEAPAITPIDKDDLKQQLRLPATFTADDMLLDSYAEAATTFAENYTYRKFIDQEITLYLDRFPTGSYRDAIWEGVLQGTESMFRNSTSNYIEIPWAPVISITEVSTFDSSNNETTYPASNYYLDNFDNDMFARVVFNDNASYPTNLRDENAIKIVYRSGYGTQKDDVPANLRVGMMMIGAYLYANNGACSDCSCIAASGASSFLEPSIIYKVR